MMEEDFKDSIDEGIYEMLGFITLICIIVVTVVSLYSWISFSINEYLLRTVSAMFLIIGFSIYKRMRIREKYNLDSKDYLF